jgi:hypothetical protein
LCDKDGNISNTFLRTSLLSLWGLGLLFLLFVLLLILVFIVIVVFIKRFNDSSSKVSNVAGELNLIGLAVDIYQLKKAFLFTIFSLY